MRRKLVIGGIATVAALGIGIPSVLATTAPSVPSPGVAYGCVVGANRTFQDVYQSETNYQNFLASNGGSCPSGGFKEVVGYAPPSSPTPTPTPTTPTPTTPTPTPSNPTTPPPTTSPPVSGSWTCTTTTVPHGNCPATTGAYESYAGMSDFSNYWTYGGPFLDQNVWAGVTGQTQSMRANSPGDWQVTSYIKPGSNPSNAVTTYPNSGFDINEPNTLLTSMPDITSTFADTVPAASTGASGWQGYDLWFNSWGDEEMIQTQYVNAAPCSYDAVQQFKEPGTGTEQTFGLCNFGGPGGEKVWHLVPDGTVVGGNAVLNETSGSVDITAMTDYLISNGYMKTSTPASTTVTALSAGFEIVQSPVNTTWGYSNLTFSATAPPAS